MEPASNSEEKTTDVPNKNGETVPRSHDDSVSVEYPNAFRATCIALGVALDMTIVATAIPSITDDFKGINLVGWYGSAFFIVLACFQPFWGKVYPLFSVKYTFLAAVFIFDVGSLIAGLAPSSTVLILGRAVMGAGGAGIATGVYAILPIVIRPRLRPLFTGLISTVYSISTVVGPILGGLFAQHTTWRWCFYVNLPIGGVCAIVLVLLFHPKPRPQHSPVEKTSMIQKLAHMDLGSLVLALASLILFTHALEIAGIHSAWNSNEIIGLLVACFVVTVAFVVSQYAQRKTKYALIPSRLMRLRTVAVAMAYGFFHEGAFYLFLYYMPIFFQVVVGLAPSEAGVLILPLLISSGLGSMVSGALVSRFGYSALNPLMMWASAGGCVASGLVYTLNPTSSSAQWIGYQVLAGLAYGSGLPLPTIAGQAVAQPKDLTVTSSMLLFAEAIGSSTSLGAGQSAMSNLLLSSLLITAPDVNPLSVIATGAAEIRTSFAPEVVPGIVMAYHRCIRAVFLIVTAYAGTAVLSLACNKWREWKLKANNSAERDASA